jgi:hypothetical protein
MGDLPRNGKRKSGRVVMGDLPRWKNVLIVMGDLSDKKTWRIGRVVMGDLPRKNIGEGSKAHSKGSRVRKRTTQDMVA